MAGWDFKRVLTSRGANLLATLLLNPKVSDLTGSFRLYKREVLSDLMLCVKGRAYVFQMEVITPIFCTLCIYLSHFQYTETGHFFAHHCIILALCLLLFIVVASLFPFAGDCARAAQGILYRGGAHRVRGPHLWGVQAGRRRDRLLPKVRTIGMCVLYYTILLYALYVLYYTAVCTICTILY